MREIKFRAWDELDNNMIHQDYLSASEMLNRFDCIMQYTGLKDKEGKEIYEGDIVTHNGQNINAIKNPLLLVVFLDGAFCLTAKKVYKNNEIPSVTIRGAMFQAMKNDISLKLKVIGNKYENPELLGGE